MSSPVRGGSPVPQAAAEPCHQLILDLRLGVGGLHHLRTSPPDQGVPQEYESVEAAGGLAVCSRCLWPQVRALWSCLSAWLPAWGKLVSSSSSSLTRNCLRFLPQSQL